MRARNIFAAFAVTLAAAAVTVVAPSEAQAAPGTCKCNMGCHSSPGQCTKLTGNNCGYGYRASCGIRDGCSSGYVSCSGACTCEPIPGFCETTGGAEYCDAGPSDTGAPDTGTPDTGTPDTGTPDTFVPDTFVPDTFVPDTTVVDTFVPDTFVPDTNVEDTFVPDTLVPDTETPDTFVPDTFVPDTAPPVDSCVPAACAPGTRAVTVPGECDPYCAQPCGSGEFKCSGLAGTECSKDGFCVPKCLATPCADCKRCGGDGLCFDDVTSCDGGVPDGFVSEAGADSGTGGDGAAAEDSGPISFDTGSSAEDGSTGDATSGADTGDGFGDPAADPATQGGCGCSVPGNNADNTLAGLAAAAALAMVFARRRRK